MPFTIHCSIPVTISKYASVMELYAIILQGLNSSCPINKQAVYDPQNSIVHLHLQTQFKGVITKLEHDLEAIHSLGSITAELKSMFLHLKQRLIIAHLKFSQSTPADLAQNTQKFYDACQQTIEEYGHALKQWLLLTYDGDTKTRIDNAIIRFFKALVSLISYTFKSKCELTVTTDPLRAYTVLKGCSPSNT